VKDRSLYVENTTHEDFIYPNRGGGEGCGMDNVMLSEPI